MSVLDSFYILFKTNAQEAKKDIGEAKKASDDFQHQLNENDEKLKSIAGSLIDIGVRAISAYATFDALKNGIKNAQDLNVELYRQSALTGENVKAMSSWDDAFANLTGKKGEFLGWFGQYSQYLQSIGRDTKTIMPDLLAFSDAIAKMPEAQARMAFQQAKGLFGLPEDFYIPLRQGGDALKELVSQMERLNGISEHSTASANAFFKAWDVTAKSIGGFFSQLNDIVLPVLTKVLDFINTPIKIPEWLQHFLGATAVGRLLLEPLPPEQGAAAAPPSGNAPLGIRNNNPGNLNYAGQSGATANGRFAMFQSLADGLRAEGKQLEKYGSRGWDNLSSIVSHWAPSSENNTGAYLKHMMDSTGFGALQQLNLSDPAVRAKVMNAINSMEDGASYGHLVNAAKGALGFADNTSMAAPVSAGGGGSPSLTVGQITVHTAATDAQGVAAAISTELRKEYRAAMSNFDDGVAK